MVVETTFLLGRPIFRGYVSFSPGNPFMNRPWFDNRKDHWFFEDHFHTMPILNLRICPTPEVMDRRHHTCLQHALQNHDSWCWNQMTTIKSSINFTTNKETADVNMSSIFASKMSHLSSAFHSFLCPAILSPWLKKHRGIDDEVGLLIPQLWILGIASQQPPTYKPGCQASSFKWRLSILTRLFKHSYHNLKIIQVAQQET